MPHNLWENSEGRQRKRRYVLGAIGKELAIMSYCRSTKELIRAFTVNN